MFRIDRARSVGGNRVGQKLERTRMDVNAGTTHDQAVNGDQGAQDGGVGGSGIL